MATPDALSVPSQPATTEVMAAGSRKPGLILAFVCVAQFMVFLDVTVVNVALPSIRRSLGMAETDLQYMVTAYGTVLGGFLLLGGRLADTFGRRRLLQAGLSLFAATSCAAGLAQDPTVLVVARGFHGAFLVGVGFAIAALILALALLPLMRASEHPETVHWQLRFSPAPRA